MNRLTIVLALGISFSAVCAGAQAVSDFQSRSQRISASKSLPYRLFVPKGYKAGTRYALMLTLHGAGERGSDNAAQLAHDFNKHWAADSVQAVRPCFVVAPQCPADNKWADVDWAKGSYDQSQVPISDELQAVVAILDSLGREFTLDPSRVYVSGLSMGGYGTWDLIARYPARFAAAVPVCGAGDPRKATSLSSLPIWAFHAEDDPVVPVSGSRDMINALKAAGGQPKYVEYAKALGVGHSSWVPAGRDPGLTPWVFAQARATTSLAPPSVPDAGRAPGNGRATPPGSSPSGGWDGMAWLFRDGGSAVSHGSGPVLVVDGLGRLRRVD